MGWLKEGAVVAGLLLLCLVLAIVVIPDQLYSLYWHWKERKMIQMLGCQCHPWKLKRC